jgi:UDP-2-acetamido-3-amino-2,3-dideoxy-glucuronate N-acetyltransferase
MVYGNPAKHQGWVSKAGHKLVFDDNNMAIDTFDNSRYKLVNNAVEIL